MDSPWIFLARGAYAGSGSSDDYSLNWTAVAYMGRKLRIAHIENKSRLPSGICGDFVEQRGARGRSAQRPLMVHHFHGLVTGARGKSVGSREEMRALPASACLQALFLGVSVAHSDESDQRRAEHQVRIAILGAAGSSPAEHPRRHHLCNRSSYGRQAEGINREAIAVFLDRTRFRADPTFAAMLNIWIGIDFRSCGGTHFGG